MKLRLYLDTSVFSAYYDDRLLDRQTLTEDFWKRLGDFEISTSELAKQELDQSPDPEQRARFERLFSGFIVHAVTDEMKELARHYVDAGVFSPASFNDALHVAAAVLTRQDVLLSWNFRHLVNRRRRARVNEVNISRALPTIEILAPPEI